MAKSRTQRVAIRLSTAARTALGMAGLFSFVIGVFAIFRPTSTEVGGVALIILAGVFGLLAAIGVFPSRVSAAGVTAEISYIEEVADGASPSEKRRIADEAESAAPEDPKVQAFSARLRSAALFEEAVLAELSSYPDFAIDTSRDAVRFRLQDPDRVVAVDAVLTVRDQRWAVEVRSFTRRETYRWALRRLMLAASSDELSGGILVTDREPEEFVYGEKPIHVLVVKELRDLTANILWYLGAAQ